MNIFVAKLSPSTTSEDLKNLFAAYGEVTSAKVIIDKNTGFSKRYGFVEMSNENEANEAISKLNETEFDKSVIVVKIAQPREETGQRHTGYNRR
ncbi:MAG: RNA-binding protein [Bacteroidales bacterium]|nr:RNA-binding protein [Bacteroidales bacterium]HOY38436.1 RNA-binding protein [Bacteroidales bacterium]HQP03127.1 RNA-binding protein [Bacteroidales bacterium]